jgi:hypothetical protein
MPAIFKSNEHMQVVTYTGTGAAQTLYCGFKPDLVWIKSRSATTDHKLTDSVRGVTKALISNTTGTETTDTNGVTAFTDTGFTIGSDSNYNTNGATYVAWCWKAGQGITSTNVNGSITSTVSVNASAGFSVVTYTGTDAAATVGHGLGVTPSMIVTFPRTTVTFGNHAVYHISLGNTKAVKLNLTSAPEIYSGWWNNTSPTSSVFSVGTFDEVNNISTTYVAYCWAPIAGFSAFGSYTGNGSADGPFVYMGFRPKFVMVRRTDADGNWVVMDTSREPYNSADRAVLFPNLTNAEGTGTSPNDILSNGFKPRNTGVATNASGGTFIYMAFAENPFKNSLAR